MHQVVYFGIIIIENSVAFVGRYVFTEMLGPVMDSYMNHYQYEFSLDSLVRGQETSDKFFFDFRNTRDPNMFEGKLDFFLFGDTIYDGEGCSMAPDYLGFDYDGVVDSQIVVSESAASCFATKLAKSKLGHIHLDRPKVNAFWDTGDRLDFSTSSLHVHLPLL